MTVEKGPLSYHHKPGTHTHTHTHHYHHKPGLKTYKTRPHEMFSWHPSYLITEHRLSSTTHSDYIDHPSNWTAATVIRKDINFSESVSSTQLQ